MLMRYKCIQSLQSEKENPETRGRNLTQGSQIKVSVKACVVSMYKNQICKLAMMTIINK